VANEAARRAASDSASQPVTVLKETESRALYGTPASSPRIAIRSVPQRVDTTANKPVDQLAKDKKQEVQVAQQAQTAVAGNQRVQVDVPRREPFGATIAKPDTARVERPQEIASDAAAKGVAAGVVKGRVTDANNVGLSDVTVSVAGTNTGVVTNAAGEFTIGGLRGGGYQLNVRRVGYQPVDRDVTVVSGQTSQMDVVLSATPLALSNVVVTGAAGAAPRDAGARARTAPAPAPVVAAAPGASITAAQTNAVGCYELGITALSASRNAFREVPRRVALDSVSMPARADGVWYRARDLARPNALPNGLWRPTGPDGVELEWVYGSRTARIHVSGPAGSIMRGNLEEIDRAKASGEAANVVAIRRACEP
jgi:CarboxypepD_reg-like domain